MTLPGCVHAWELALISFSFLLCSHKTPLHPPPICFCHPPSIYLSVAPSFLPSIPPEYQSATQSCAASRLILPSPIIEGLNYWACQPPSGEPFVMWTGLDRTGAGLARLSVGCAGHKGHIYCLCTCLSAPLPACLSTWLTDDIYHLYYRGQVCWTLPVCERMLCLDPSLCPNLLIFVISLPGRATAISHGHNALYEIN